MLISKLLYPVYRFRISFDVKPHSWHLSNARCFCQN